MSRAVADAETVVAARRREQRENFPVALRLLPRTPRRHLHAIYAVARLIDDVGDDVERPAGERVVALDDLRRDIARLWTGGAPDHPVVRALAPTVAACRLSPAPFDALIEANLRDQTTQRYQTFADLAAYCALSANPVGHLVLAVAQQSTQRNREASDAVCTALQLLEHCQDVVEDLRDRARVYLPVEDMDRHGVDESDLSSATASPALRVLLEFEVARARRLLESGAPLVRELRGWARIAVAGYVAGGRATADAFERARYDVVTRAPRPRRRDVGTHALRLLVNRR